MREWDFIYLFWWRGLPLIWKLIVIKFLYKHCNRIYNLYIFSASLHYCSYTCPFHLDPFLFYDHFLPFSFSVIHLSPNPFFSPHVPRIYVFLLLIFHNLFSPPYPSWTITNALCRKIQSLESRYSNIEKHSGRTLNFSKNLAS